MISTSTSYLNVYRLNLQARVLFMATFDQDHNFCHTAYITWGQRDNPPYSFQILAEAYSLGFIPMNQEVLLIIDRLPAYFQPCGIMDIMQQTGYEQIRALPLTTPWSEIQPGDTFSFNLWIETEYGKRPIEEIWRVELDTSFEVPTLCLKRGMFHNTQIGISIYADDHRVLQFDIDGTEDGADQVLLAYPRDYHLDTVGQIITQLHKQVD